MASRPACWGDNIVSGNDDVLLRGADSPPPSPNVPAAPSPPLPADRSITPTISAAAHAWPCLSLAPLLPNFEPPGGLPSCLCLRKCPPETRSLESSSRPGQPMRPSYADRTTSRPERPQPLTPRRVPRSVEMSIATGDRLQRPLHHLAFRQARYSEARTEHRDRVADVRQAQTKLTPPGGPWRPPDPLACSPLRILSRCSRRALSAASCEAYKHRRR